LRGAERRALWAVAPLVLVAAAAGTSACGPSSRVAGALLRQSPAVAAPVEALSPEPPADLAAPASLPADAPSTPSPRSRQVAVRTQPAPRPQRADDTLFTIEIPRLGLSAKVHEGQSLPVLARGPGHLPGSALPGEPGNVVIPGHRTAAPHPFLDIDRLQNGDQIALADGGGRFVYVVTGTAIVSPDDTSVTEPTADPTVTLYACHPKGSDRQRYVVFGRLLGATAPPGKAPSSPGPTRNGSPPDSAPPDSAPRPASCGLVPCVHR